MQLVGVSGSGWVYGPRAEEGFAMVGCIVTGHGDFALGLSSALEMIAGPQEEFRAVPFHEEGAGEYAKKISDAVRDMVDRDGSCVVFCDLVGGTPFNQSMMLTGELPQVQVVAGTNLPMLLEGLMSRDDSMTAEGLAALAQESGRSGVAHLSVTGAAADEEPGEDGI